MLSFKDRLLRLYANQYTKKSKFLRFNPGFDHASVIGILGSAEQTLPEDMARFAKKIEALDRAVDVLCYIGKIASKDIQLPSNMIPLTYQDVNWLGSISNRRIQVFLNKQFSYLYHIDPYSNSLLDYLLAKCKARCRVGYFHPDRKQLFEVMVDPADKGATPKHDMMQLLHYTQKLKATEKPWDQA